METQEESTIEVPESGIFDELAIKLSPNEKKVLVGLLRYPSKKDTEICEILKMRKSTFSTIKSRLEQQELYNRVTIPGFPKIGAELFCMSTARLTLRLNSQKRLERLQEVLELFREDIFSLGESENIVIFSVSKNFTDFDRNNQFLAQIGWENNIFLRSGLSYHVFPFETTQFVRFFSYAPLISRLFNAEGPLDKNYVSENDSLPYNDNNELFHFSQAERKVFYGLLQYPNMSNRALADHINVSKNTLASIKKRFLDQNVLLPRVIPNLTKLGIRLLVLLYGFFRLETTISQRQKGIAKVDETLKPIILAVKDLEFIVVYAAQNF